VIFNRILARVSDVRAWYPAWAQEAQVAERRAELVTVEEARRMAEEAPHGEFVNFEGRLPHLHEPQPHAGSLDV
jgi:hypothetical protein